MANLVNAIYTTVWDNGRYTIKSNCIVNQKTLHITEFLLPTEDSDKVCGDELNILDDEFVEFEDGTKYPAIELEQMKTEEKNGKVVTYKNK